MSLKAQSQEVVNAVNPSSSELRRYSKEALIEAILEMKRIDISGRTRVAELDLQLRKLEHQIEMHRINQDVSMSLIEKIEKVKDHEYGPKAIGDLSLGVATIMSDSGSPEEGDGVRSRALMARVNRARSQGMRWNHSDKTPERRSTILKKVEAWERGVTRGLQEPLEGYCSITYEQAIEKGGEAFVVGLCEQIESLLGIGPSSKYLKTRYKRDTAKLATIYPPVEPVQTDSDEHAEGLIKRVWGDSLDKSQKSAIKKHLVSRIDKSGGVGKLSVKSLRSLCDSRCLPTFFDFPEEPSHPVDRLNDLKAGKYDNKYKTLLEDYRSSL